MVEEVAELLNPEEYEMQETALSVFDPKTMRKTNSGLKCVLLTLSVLFSFILGFPFLWKSVEIYRAPLPFREIDSLSAQLDSSPLLFSCHFQAIFVGFNSKTSTNDLESSILDRMTQLTSRTPQSRTCSSDYTVSVVVDSNSHCLHSKNSKPSWVKVPALLLTNMQRVWGRVRDARVE